MFLLRRGTSHVLNYNLNEELKLQASRTMRNSGPLAHLAGYLRSIQIILTLFEHWSWKSMKIARSSSHQKQSIFNEKTISRQVKNHEMSLLYLQFVKQILSLTITVFITARCFCHKHRISSHCQATEICTQRLDKYDGNVWDSKQFIERAEPSTWVPRFMPASPRTEANATQMHVLTTSSADKSLRLWDVLGTKFHDDNQSKWSSNEEEYWHQWCPEGCVALCFTCFSSEETRSKD